MTQPGADWDRLGRYLAGELSPAEAGEVQRWLSENGDDARVLAALDGATRGLPASRPVDVELALGKVKARLARQATPWTKYVPWLAAAALVLAVGSQLMRDREAVRPTTPTVAYSTGVGARDSVVLADGSHVVLGPGTRIAVQGRDVELSGGEAFSASSTTTPGRSPCALAEP
jgi:ferric-dicitrate binding protein FerR (iron transport regulator)